MTWSDFFLICFAVGFFLSFFSFLFGGARTGRLHLPHFHGHGGHLPAVHAPVAHAPNAHGPAVPGANAGVVSCPPKGAVRVEQGHGVSPFNFITFTAFLAWFGGAGFLLTRYSGLWVGLSLLISIGMGIIGGGIIFLFLSRVLTSPEESMDLADYDMVGVLGQIAVPIRAEGTGELIYSQMGTRRVCGARSDDGSSIAKGVEVIVTRYEKGIAYVRLWSQMSGEEAISAQESASTKEPGAERSEI